MEQFKSDALAKPQPVGPIPITEELADEFLNELRTLRDKFSDIFPAYIGDVERRINQLLPENLQLPTAPVESVDEEYDPSQVVGDTADAVAVLAGIALACGALPLGAFLGGFAAGLYLSGPLYMFLTAEGDVTPP